MSEQPQEWTHENGWIRSPDGEHFSELHFERLVAAINAALAAERELVKRLQTLEVTLQSNLKLYQTELRRADKEREIAIGVAIGLKEKLLETEEQLAAARKQRDDFRRALEQRVGELDELREQLK
jgi:hypothetical protein